MSLKLWNYSRGYVIIEVDGFSKERFINLVANKDIYVWDIRQSHNVLEMKVSIEGYKKLKPLWRKASVKVRIIKKEGIPFYRFRYRKRKILIFGLIFFVIALYGLSAFVWKIDISGNERVSTESINKFLEKNDVKVGSLKNNINNIDIENLLLKNFEDLFWVSLRKNGTTLEVLIAENIDKKYIIDRDTPCDVIAKEDGIIDSMATSSGEAVVTVGDVVKKGDLLVKSEVYLREDEFGKHYTYVHAEAEVIAKRYIYFDFVVPKVVTISKYTGKKEIDYSIVLFDKDFKLSYHKKKYDNSLYFTDMKQLKFGKDYPLPIIFVKSVELETRNINKELSENEMIEFANKSIKNKIISDLDFNIDVINKVVDYKVVDKGLHITGYLEVLEKIDLKREVDIDEIKAQSQNAQDEVINN